MSAAVVSGRPPPHAVQRELLEQAARWYRGASEAEIEALLARNYWQHDARDWARLMTIAADQAGIELGRMVLR